MATSLSSEVELHDYQRFKSKSYFAETPQLFRMSSAYALQEARRDLAVNRSEDVPRLKRLLESVATVDAAQGLKLPESIRLEPKDRPILLAAIDAKGSNMLTGERRRWVGSGRFAIIARKSDGGKPPFPKNAPMAFSPLWQVLRMSRVRMPPDRVQLTWMRSLGNSVAALWL